MASPYAEDAQANRSGPSSGPSVMASVASANEMLEGHLKRLHAVIGRIQGHDKPEPTTDRGGVVPTRIGAPSLMELLDRHGRLVNEFQGLLNTLEDFV